MNEERRILALLQEIEDNAKLIRQAMTAAFDVQYVASKASQPTRAYLSDPTGDAVVDERRLQVRRAIKACDKHLVECAARMRGLKKGTQKVVNQWDAE